MVDLSLRWTLNIATMYKVNLKIVDVWILWCAFFHIVDALRREEGSAIVFLYYDAS
jgi:hypothetical protein